MKSKEIFLIALLISIQNFSAQETILWKIDKPDSQKVSYLIGTLHQAGNSFIDERPQITELISRSDIAVFESTEDGKKTIIDVINRRPDDFSYRQYLDKKDVEYLEKISSGWTVPLSKLQPAELAVKLEQVYVSDVCETLKSTDSWNVLDNYLIHLAEKSGKKTLGLETSSDQFKAINSNQELTWANAKKLVNGRVTNLKRQKNKNQICRVSKTYMSDMNFDYQFDVKCAENDAILSNRNKKWMPKIDDILHNNNAFIAVGLMHLFGDCGIISELRKKGYQVTPVPLLKDSTKINGTYKKNEEPDDRPSKYIEDEILKRKKSA